MAGISAVGIDDDFAAGQAGIAHRAADGEAPGWIDQESGILVHQLGRNGFADHLINDGGGKRLMADFGRVLGGNDDRIDANGLVPVVLDRHLTLSVRAQPRQLLAPARLRKAARDAVRQRDGHGHHLGRFIAGKAEHHALIAGADGVHLVARLAFERPVNAQRDIGRLPVEPHLEGEGIGVKAVFGAGVADAAHRFAGDGLVIGVNGAGDFAHNHQKVGGSDRFRRHTAVGVGGEDGVNDRVRYSVADFVRVPLGHRFRGKKSFCHVDSPLKMICRTIFSSGKQKPSARGGMDGFPHLSDLHP